MRVVCDQAEISLFPHNPVLTLQGNENKKPWLSSEILKHGFVTTPPKLADLVTGGVTTLLKNRWLVTRYWSALP